MDIESFYQEVGIKLEKTGNRWRSVCPFHTESSASFVVYPDGGYHCFGCGAHGTSRDIQEIYGVNFRPYANPMLAASDPKQQALRDFRKTMEKRLGKLMSECSGTRQFRAYDMFDTMLIDARFLSRDPESSVMTLERFFRKRMGKISRYVSS